jgi:hypothetical protein
VPVVVALKVTGAAQLELVRLAGLRVQLAGVKLPPAGLLLKLTVPPGGDFMPLSVSVTVAVQVVEPPSGISAAAQLTSVEVVRACTVIVAGVVLVLELWVVSPAPGV